MQQPRIVFQFNRQPVEDQEASAAAGHPVYREVDYIKKLVPGDTSFVVHREIRREDLNDPELRKAYEHWKRGEEAPTQGLPLEKWPGCTAGQALTLKAVNVRTVEELATVADANIMRLGMGFQTLRQAAQDYLAAAKDNSHITTIRHQMEEQRNQLEATRRQLEEALVELRALKATPAQQPLLEGAKGKRA